MPAATPEYPFQCICADYFHYKGLNYLVVVDRYSNWPVVEQASDGSQGLIACLRRIFVTFGIADELASDGGPEFTAAATKTFLQNWGVHHRLSSVAFPHSNCRAEVGVKTMKRLITSNTGPRGELDTDALQRAVLQYRNTPDPETKISPALSIFRRPIKDFIPILPGRYKPHPTWIETMTAREEALRNRHMKTAERWTEHTKQLPPLAVGNHVRIQNQTGPHPKRWDKTGVVVEVRQFDQYVVRIDGSGRVTLRNRKFLRRYEPVVPQRSTLRTLEEDIRYAPTATLTGAHGHMPQISQTTGPAATLPSLPTIATPEVTVTPAQCPVTPAQHPLVQMPAPAVTLAQRLVTPAKHPPVQMPATSSTETPRAVATGQPLQTPAPGTTDPPATPTGRPRQNDVPGTPQPVRPQRVRRPPVWQKDYV